MYIADYDKILSKSVAPSHQPRVSCRLHSNEQRLGRMNASEYNVKMRNQRVEGSKRLIDYQKATIVYHFKLSVIVCCDPHSMANYSQLQVDGI